MGLKEERHRSSLPLMCDCGHAILNLNVDRLDNEGYWELFEMNFYTLQQPFWNNLKENIKLIWSVIRGKRFCMYGVIITRDQWDELKKFINSIDTEEKTNKTGD